MTNERHVGIADLIVMMRAKWPDWDPSRFELERTQHEFIEFGDLPLIADVIPEQARRGFKTPSLNKIIEAAQRRRAEVARKAQAARDREAAHRHAETVAEHDAAVLAWVRSLSDDERDDWIARTFTDRPSLTRFYGQADPMTTRGLRHAMYLTATKHGAVRALTQEQPV